MGVRGSGSRTSWSGRHSIRTDAVGSGFRVPGSTVPGSLVWFRVRTCGAWGRYYRQRRPRGTTGPFRIEGANPEPGTRNLEPQNANLAEGFSRYLPADMARFFRMTRGSHSEILEHLTSAVRRQLLTERDIDSAVSFARRARGACTKLIIYLETAKAPGRD
jgi:hypothetical protein